MQARSIQGGSRIGDNRNASFGQRRSMADTKGKQKADFTGQGVRATGDGGMEVSWVPSSKSNGTLEDDDEAMESSSRGGKKNKGQEKDRRKKGIEIFGAGMEKGGEAQEAAAALSESERSGRMHRRKGMRSGSKNTFRRM